MIRGPRKSPTPSSQLAMPDPVARAPETVMIEEVAPPEERALVPVPQSPSGLVPSPARTLMLIRHVGGDRYVHPRPKPLPRGRWRLTLWHSWVVVVVCLALLGALGAVSLRDALQSGPQLPAGLKEVNGSLVPSGPLDPRAASAPLGVGGGAAPGVGAPGTAGLPVTAATTSPPSTATPVPPVAALPPSAPTPTPNPIQPAPMSPWPPTNPWVYVQAPCSNYFSYLGRCTGSQSWPGGFYPGSFGQCTWWSLRALADEGYSTSRMEDLGNAEYWAADAAAQGFAVTSMPLPDSTVVFQPGVEGAGGGGHVAHVIAVYPDGWFLISEMNFYRKNSGVENGGWGIVDYRYAFAAPGVQFIPHP